MLIPMPAARRCSVRMERLTQILASSFPGSTIYRHANLLRVPGDALHHRVDAVLLAAEMEQMSSFELVERLHRHKPELLVLITSETNEFYEKAARAGADGYFVLPGGEEQLVEAIRLAKNKKKTL